MVMLETLENLGWRVSLAWEATEVLQALRAPAEAPARLEALGSRDWWETRAQTERKVLWVPAA